MRNIICPLLLLICFTAYSQSDQTDPYFIETHDIVSAFGPVSLTRHILEDSKGNMWFATWQGIMKYDGKVFTNYTLRENLIHFHVFSIMEDSHGNLWFGTIGGGAYRYDGKTFILFTTNDGLVDDVIIYIMEDRTGDIWFATDKGISRMDVLDRPSVAAPKKRFITYTTDNGLAGNRVNTITQDKKGKIWIGTRTGVSCYDGIAFSDFVIRKDMPFTNVWSIKEDKTGKIWIAGQDGLYRYDPVVSGERAFTKLLPNFAGSVFEDKAGVIWFNLVESSTLYEKGVYKCDGAMITKIIAERTFEVSGDRRGNIWFGTSNGPVRYDGKNVTYFRK
jgi:ligand-binding sensor domain-containing protein